MGQFGTDLRHRIGLVYLPGALPCFEDFGNLPTDLVCSDALVDGKPASEILDMIIIPGGSLVESQSVNKKVAREIIKMADSGKFVLGNLLRLPDSCKRNRCRAAIKNPDNQRRLRLAWMRSLSH